MSATKFIARMGTSIIFYLFFLIYLSSLFVAAQNPEIVNLTNNRLMISAIALSFFAMIFIDFLRLMFGMNIVMVKKDVRNQKLMFGFKIILFSSLIFLEFKNYTLLFLFLSIGGIGSLVVRTRAWKIFTDIRESDHPVFKRRLIITCIAMGILSILALFSPSNEFFLLRMLGGASVAYIFASIFIGWKNVALFNHYAMGATDALVGPSDEEKGKLKAYQKEPMLYDQTSAFIASDIRMKEQLAGHVKFGMFALSITAAIILGCVMIPFYIYILVTKKVTVFDAIESTS